MQKWTVIVCCWQAFFESYHDLCEPSCYKPMLHDDHLDDLKRFRTESRSWSGDTDRHGSHKKGTQQGPSKTRCGRMRSCRRLPWFVFSVDLCVLSRCQWHIFVDHSRPRQESGLREENGVLVSNVESVHLAHAMHIFMKSSCLYYKPPKYRLVLWVDNKAIFLPRTRDRVQ